ncbi:hypothetical protein U9858_08675 [Escherichia coli]
MSREGTLDLLQEVEECLESMRETQQIKPVKVKSLLENLRSSLEYVANDSFDKYRSTFHGKKPKIHFPYGKQIFIDNFFIKELKIIPPSSSPLYELINSFQSYHTDEDWLGMMCNLTNEVKHRQPIPLEEDSVVKGIDVTVNGIKMIKADASSNIVFKNGYVNGEKIEDFTFQDGKVETSGNGTPLNIVITEERKIRFHGVDYEVIPFLELCLKNIKAFVNKSYDILDEI